jgi:hypothetical protein
LGKRVYHTRPLIDHLENSLQSAFNPNAKLSRQIERQSGPEFKISLKSGKEIWVDDDHQQIVQAVLVDGELTNMFFGFVATFRNDRERKPRYYLLDASLSVFQDMVNDVIPFFRAEWDQGAAEDLSSTHAQPHWHFTQSAARIERLVKDHSFGSAVLPSPEPIEFVPERERGLLTGTVDSAKFHFAMTSLWADDDVLPKKRLFDSDDFRDWFGGLTAYIAGQIKYVVDRTSVRERAFKPFRE